MENSNNNIPPDAILDFAFPKSNEDHRLQLLQINGSIFAILFAPLESNGPIQLGCDEWSLVLLAPIKSKKNITISAINIICLSDIASEEGAVSLHASNHLVKYGTINPPENTFEIGEKGVSQFNEDLGALLNYHRLFNGVITNARTRTPDTIALAQQMFLLSLCTLANKIEGKLEDLDLRKVFSIWNIPYINSQ